MTSVFVLGDTTVSQELVGQKAWNLAELMRISGVAVPRGCVVSSALLANTLETTAAKGLVRRLDNLLNAARVAPARQRRWQPEVARAARALRRHIASRPLGRSATEEICEAVSSLSAATGARTFAVRSSGTAEDLAEMSYAGMYHTELFCAERTVNAAVRKCFASLFSDRAIMYRLEAAASLDAGLPLAAGSSLAVVIQPMIRARSSGVAFSVDPVSGDPAVTVEAGFGVGKLVVDNRITCDRWRLSGDGSGVLERTLGGKEHALWNGPRGRMEQIRLPERRSFCLSDEEVLEIGRLVALTANHFAALRGWPGTDIEFTVDAEGSIWLLQARSETTGTKARHGLVQGVPRRLTRSATTIFHGGVPASLGAAHGRVTICTNVEDARCRIDETSILVAHEITPEWEEVVFLPAGIIAEIGGVHSHPAIVSRERRVPCLVAATNAIDVLTVRDGTPATLDSTNARVYEGFLALESGRPSSFRVHDTLKPPISEDARLGITVHHVAVDGEQFIGKPEYPLGLWQRTLYLEAWQLAEEWLGVRLKRKVERDTIYVSRHALSALAATMRDHGCDWLRGLLKRRQEATERLARASASLVPSAAALGRIHAIYREAVAHFHLRFTFQLVLDSLLQERPDVMPPIRSRDVGLRETETARAAAAYRSLLADAGRSAELFVGDASTMAPALQRAGCHELIAAIIGYARSYKHQSDDIRLPPPVDLILERLRDDIRSGRQRAALPSRRPRPTQKGDARPDELSSPFALAEAAAIQKEYEHHTLVRAQWPIRDGLLQLGEALVLRRWIGGVDEVFATPPAVLTALVARLELAP